MAKADTERLCEIPGYCAGGEGDSEVLSLDDLHRHRLEEERAPRVPGEGGREPLGAAGAALGPGWHLCPRRCALTCREKPLGWPKAALCCPK